MLKPQQESSLLPSKVQGAQLALSLWAPLGILGTQFEKKKKNSQMDLVSFVWAAFFWEKKWNVETTKNI